VVVGLTTHGLPVCTSVPPQLPVYQSMTSLASTVPERVDELPEQIAAGLAVTPVGAFTVRVA